MYVGENDKMYEKIKQSIYTAMKHHCCYVKIGKTSNEAVNQAMCEIIDIWGYKVAQNNSFIFILL